MESAANKNDFRNLYGLLQRASKTENQTRQLIRDGAGEIITNIDARMNRWKEHFQNLLNFSSPTNDITFQDSEKNAENYDCTCSPPSTLEIENAVKHLKNNKALGEDGIPAEI